eukprot:GHVU01221298.1.p1 GENE.GHVU01221298.1~~GHVU01221298.1.p1  ORF type:complete len:218 (+),score=50.23 GHVU01221298.1:648-1301(+)
MGQKQSTENTVFDLKLKARELKRLHERCKKEEEAEKYKVKKGIEQNDLEGARIHAQNAIRKRTDALNYLSLASKIDAMASKLDSATRTQELSKDVSTALPSLRAALRDLDSATLSTHMHDFEAIFEELDVQSEIVSESIVASTVTSTPAEQVDKLVAEVAETHALDVSELLPPSARATPASASATATAAASTAPPTAHEEAPAPSLEKRLDDLKAAH